MEAEQPKKGWGYPQLSKRAHDFVDGVALCRKWMFFGRLDTNGLASQDDCAKCRKLYEKLHDPGRSLA